MTGAAPSGPGGIAVSGEGEPRHQLLATASAQGRQFPGTSRIDRAAHPAFSLTAFSLAKFFNVVKLEVGVGRCTAREAQAAGVLP